ncbi:NosD domain-containing protein, partial [Candidatus Alkanophaga liquidiphilum]
MKGGALLCLLVLSFLTFAGVASARTIYVPDEYAKIRWAVDDASAGDTIIVRDGVHFENIYVNKRLTIRSENGSKNCIVQAAKYDAVFHVTADYVNIYGFTIKDGKYGIYLDNVENCNIANNNISNNDDGIYLCDSSSNNITGNSISNNGNDGICLYVTTVKAHSSNNNITGNDISNNENGIHLESGSSNNNVTGNDISNNENGIYLYESSNNSITGNDISNNVDGIHLRRWSNNNNITGNDISNNDCGIGFEDYSSDNIIYLNNFINNTDSVYYSPYPSTNIWSSILQITYTYKGKTYKNYLCNYWGDYTGSDADNDGIGDTPYIIDHDKDHYPLMKPFENYFAPESQPPVASFTYSPKHPSVNQPVTFDASASYDPDGTIVSYEWDFGDGTTASGVVVTHAYSAAGSYTVTLTV